MQSLGPLHRFRLTLAVRMAATCLIVLTILPFTAPFSTFDLAEVTENAGHGDGASAAKESKDLGPALTVTTAFDCLTPIATAQTTDPLPLASIFVQKSLVLRL